MASNSNPNSWVPYMNMKDCSQGFCSMYCPQWCYIVISPPPPLELPGDGGNSSKPSFSPLVIAIIGIFASAFLLVSYYTLISKYCGNRNTGSDASRITRIDRNLNDPDENSIGNQDPFVHEPWQGSNTGLDDAMIKLITRFKYKKQDGLVIEGTDCSICLGEFKEDESLRMLPKCNHAFHVSCIDRWLKSHSNCPLCRANIILPVSCSPSPSLLLPMQETGDFIMNLFQYPRNYEISSLPDRDGISSDHHHSQEVRREANIVEERRTNTRTLYHQSSLPKSPVCAFIDPEKGDTIIEIRDGRSSKVRRSVSMDYISHPPPHQLSIADVLRMNQDDLEDGECSSGDYHATSVEAAPRCTSNLGQRIWNYRITDPTAMSMKRSFSSGRLFLAAQGRRTRTLNLPI